MTGVDGRGDPGGEIARRELLRLLAYGSTLAGVGASVGCSSERAAPRRSPAPARASSPRVLVVIELGGGNDAWSTLVPYESGVVRDLRPTIVQGADEVIDWGDGVGLNALLGRLADRGLAVLEGIGTEDADLSHFEMLARWHRGRVRAPLDRGPGGADDPTGVWGRLCDELGAPGELTGISLGWGDHPSMISSRVATTGLLPLAGNPLSEPAASKDLRRLSRRLAGASTSSAEPFDTAQRSLGALGDVIDLVQRLDPSPRTFPETMLGDQLAFATRLIAADVGIRVIHVPMGQATFDTHSRHRETHDPLLEEFDAAVAAFLDVIDASGLGDRVLVATTSEFGRRPRQNGDGLDHGGASVALLLGPVIGGRHGEPSPLDRFDRHDNLLATVEFDRYFATLATFMDVDPGAILPPVDGRAVEPIPELLA